MKVLVVDDDPLAAEMTAAILEDAQYTVVQAGDAIEAMACIGAAADLRAIVSDMHMPLINGIELFRSLRGDGCTLPFILLTGDAPEPLRAQEPRLSACLTKDFSMAEHLPALLAGLLEGQ